MEENKIEKMTTEYQKVQEQLQSLSMQNEQFEAQKDEYTQAKEQLEKATGKIYSSIGGVIIESNKEDALKDLAEKNELVEMRLNILKKQIDDTKKKEQELREQITEAIKDQK